MSGDEFGSRIYGLQECRAALLSLAPRLRSGIVRKALAAGGRVYRDEAKRLTPVLRIATNNRKPGTVRNAIKVRTSKRAKAAGNVGVFVNVQPAKGARFATVRSGGKRVRVLKRASQRGANSKNDPFYWRFLEFGTRKLSGFKMLTNAASRKTGEALGTITRSLTEAMATFNRPGGPR